MSSMTLKTAEEITIMREAGRIVALAHQAMRDALRPGISTGELNRIAEDVIRSNGAKPLFLGQPKPNAYPFPATITASINHELIHGIPSDERILKAGDIVSLDTGCHYQGYVGDAARTWAVGEVPASVQRLIDVTERAFFDALSMARPGNHISDIARATQQCVESAGYSVAREYTGHGIGRAMWEEPSVPNWWPKKSRNRHNGDIALVAGMTIAIEPMVMAGRPDLKELADKWTVATRDGSLSAHYENSIAITDDEPLILTAL